LLAVLLSGCEGGDTFIMKYGLDACFAWAPANSPPEVTARVEKVCGEDK